MDLLGPFQYLVSLALGLAALIAAGFSLVDVIRRPKEAFTYAGKRSKPFWLIVLTIALAVVFVLLYNPLNFLVLLSVVAAGVYLADVRPAVRQYRPGGRGGGPYGGW